MKTQNVKNISKVTCLAASLMMLGMPSANPGAAIVQINFGFCSILDGNGNPTDPIFPDDLRYRLRVKVSTDTRNNNLEVMTCHLENIPNDTGLAVIYNYKSTGEECSVTDPRNGQIISTKDWQATES